jgi:HAD superfamily hydrolase (TIGR01549 family)
MKKIKAIIFDYDGVIAESVNVKTDAFAAIYKPYGDDVVRKIINHHEANGGISRFEKFKVYHENYLNKKIDKEELDQLSKEFSKMVLQKVIDSPYVEGAIDFLSSNYNNYNFYISTGTPTTEIEKILEVKDIRKYFIDVYGSPENKDSHIKKIMNKGNYKKKEVIFIGDALTDRDAAASNHINFIGRYTTTEEIKKEKYLIENFNDLEILVR